MCLLQLDPNELTDSGTKVSFFPTFMLHLPTFSRLNTQETSFSAGGWSPSTKEINPNDNIEDPYIAQHFVTVGC